MKKFLIVILILIPAIVMLALAATGQAIKLAIKVEAKDLLIKDSSNKDLLLGETYFLDLIGQDYLDLMIQVVPAISYNLNVVFRHTEDSEGRVAIKRTGNTPFYKITPLKGGVCDLLVIAENNEEVKKTIHFYITTNELSSIATYFSMLTEHNEEQGGQILGIGETCNLTGPARLFLDCYPAESIGNNKIVWDTKDKEGQFVTIDQNGFIYPEGLGITEISAKVEDKAGGEHTFTLIINTLNAIAKRTTLYLQQEDNTADFIKENILLQKDLTVLPYNDKYHILSNGKVVEEITVIDVTKDDIGILNASYFDTVYIGIGGYQIRADYLDYTLQNKPQAASFSSSNPNLLDVSPEGIITPLSQGVATVDISIAGGSAISKTIQVSARANTFRLTRDNQSNKVGIKQEYVWGYNWLKDINILKDYQESLFSTRLADYTAHTYKDIKYSKGSGQYLNNDNQKIELKNITLSWTVDNPDYASIKDNGDITFKEAVCGNEVTLTAHEVIHGIRTRLHRNYTFKVIADINAVNVYTIEEFRGVNEAYAVSTVVHNDMFFNSDNPAFAAKYLNAANQLFVRNSVYGNGKVLKGKKGSNDFLVGIRLQGQYCDYSQGFIGIKEQFAPLVIENWELDGWDDASIPYEKADGDTLMQNIIKVDYYYGSQGEYYDYQTNESKSELPQMRNARLEYSPLVINYCYIHNATKGITLYEMSNTIVTGTIFANMILAAISLEQRYSHLSTLTLQRVVVRDTAGVGVISILYNDDFSMASDANEVTKIIIKDFFDCYTWTPTDGFGALGKVIPRSTLDNLPSTLNADAVYSTIEVAIKDMVQQMVEQAGLTLVYNGKKYVHLGILSIGLWAEAEPNRIIDQTGQFKKIPFHFNKDSVFKTTALPIPLRISLLETLLSVETLTKKSVVLCYDLTRGESAILPDADCPSNTILYKKLQG